jgi:hypothetical protein
MRWRMTIDDCIHREPADRAKMFAQKKFMSDSYRRYKEMGCYDCNNNKRCYWYFSKQSIDEDTKILWKYWMKSNTWQLSKSLEQDIKDLEAKDE